jgi:hypothetical protein
MSEWRPINTAPKDGTLILAWDGRAALLAYWGRSNAVNPFGWIGGHCHINHIDQPTHWMPLPDPPQITP